MCAAAKHGTGGLGTPERGRSSAPVPASAECERSHVRREGFPRISHSGTLSFERCASQSAEREGGENRI